MSAYAIEIRDVVKQFSLPTEKHNSLKGILLHPIRYMRTRRGADTQIVLGGVSLKIKKGEFFGILGGNGCGKSTLLKILAGIYVADSGTVEVKGKIIPFIELGVGFNGELTGRDNVFLSGALLGYNDEQIEAKYKSIVEFAELDGYMDQKLKNYSTGMHVRLAFSAVTILSEGDILLLDEILAVGDARFQKKCFDYFQALKDAKKTVIFVTHNMAAVAQYCDRAVLLVDHSVAMIGDAKKVAAAYTKTLSSD